MRKTKRFTPKVIKRFIEKGRGTGKFESYQAFHQVTRGDPSSIGRSHLNQCQGRPNDLLSDIELNAFNFARMLPDQIDIREQFPLSHEYSYHELYEYDNDFNTDYFPGTIELAKQLNVKHPEISGGGTTINWIVTTDLLITMKTDCDELYLLAIACKPTTLLNPKRDMEKLLLEKTYWNTRGVDWLLFNPGLYKKSVAETLNFSYGWVFNSKYVNPEALTKKIDLSDINGTPLNNVLKLLETNLGSMELAQHFFWKKVWDAEILIDLARDWRPHSPIHILPLKKFWELNPIASRRTAWI